MVNGMTQFIGQITVTLAARHRGAAEERLRALARQLGESFADVVYADHRGEVDVYQPVVANGHALRLVDGHPLCFDDFEIHGMAPTVDEQGPYLEAVEDAEADRWCLYGHLPGHGLKTIGEFCTREQAETIYACLTGRAYGRASNRRSQRNVAA